MVTQSWIISLRGGEQSYKSYSKHINTVMLACKRGKDFPFVYIKHSKTYNW